MNKVLILLIAVAAMVCVSGCNPIEDTSKTEVSDRYVPQVPENVYKEVYYTVGMHIILPYWQDHRYGLVAAGKELGVDVIFTGESGSDASRQVDIFRQVVDKNPAGILVCPIDEDMMTGPINEAMEKGIPVVCIDADAPGSDRLTYFGTDNYRSGYVAAEIIGEAINGEGEVGILTSPGIHSLDERVRGFEECMAENYPMVVIAAIYDDKGDPSRAANVAGQMFEDYPSLVGLFGTDAASGVGAAIALEENGRMNRVKVVAFDRDSSVLDLVEQGKIDATLVQRTFAMSYYGVKFLYDYNHNRVEAFGGDNVISPLPEKVDTGIVVVTQENVDSLR